jgi:hypothetical protein
MAYTRTVPLSSVNWTSQSYSYVNDNRNDFDTFFYTESAATNFVNGISGIEDYILQDNFLLLLTQPILHNVENCYPANFQDSLSASAFSDFSTSNYVMTSNLVSSQSIIHISLTDPNNIFNIFSLPLNNDLYYKIHRNVSDEKIILSNRCNYLEHTFVPDQNQTFFIETTAKFKDFLQYAQQGNHFCESDQISADNHVYWLSGNPYDKKWAKTFYNSSNEISSVSVDDDVVSGNYVFNRLGNVRNSEVRNNIEHRLNITNFFKTSSEVTIEKNSLNDKFFDLDGEKYLEVNWTNPEYTYENEIKTDFSFTCLFQNSDKGGQIVGNRSIGKTSGFSFIFNTGFNSFIKTIPFEDSLYTYNSDNLKNYEKTFQNSELSLIASGPEGSGIRWIYDKTNKEIHRVDIDNISLVKIELPADADIKHMETDYQNNLWVMDTNKKRFQSYNTDGSLQKSLSFNVFGIVKNWDMFYIPVLGTTPIPTFARITDFDSQGNLYRLVGNNIRKNSEQLFTFGENVQDFYVDLKDRVWVYFNNNKIIIIDSVTGKKIKETVAILSIKQERNARISGWNNNGIFSTQLLLLDNNMLLEIDEDLKIVKKTDLNISCERNFAFSFQGDWTGFKIAKRQNYTNGNYASILNPFLTFDFSYNCVNDSNDPVRHGIFRKHVEYKKYSKFNDWNGIGFVLNNTLGEFNIFINGLSVEHETFPPMTRLIRHEYPDNNRYNPIFLGVYNGKIGTISTHTGKENENLKGLIGSIYFYSHALTKGNLVTIFKDDMYQVVGKKLFNNLTVKVPSNTQHRIFKLKNFLKNSIPGIQSNFFDVNVYGELDSTVRDKVEELMKEKIQKIIPAHVELRQINWK